MDLSDLRIFKAVVEEGGITRAAERLHRVQSNVTTRIRQLEEDLGVPLFLREGKRLHLAPAGLILRDYADRLLNLAEEAREALYETTPRGLFRLGAMESTAAVRLPKILADFNKLYPDVELELRTGNPTQLSTALLAGELDAALMAEPVAVSRFDSLVAFEEEPVIVTARDHASLKGPKGTPSSILVFEHGCPHRRQLESWYAARGETPERIVELGSYHALLGCALAGMGAALLPRSVLSTFPESKRLKVHKLQPGEDRLRTLFVWRKGASSPKVKALAELLTPKG